MRAQSLGKDLALIALFAALMGALVVFPSIPVGLPAPIKVQTIGVMLAGGVLGSRRGFLAVALFLVMIAIGLPVRAEGVGLAPFVGPTGGFLWAYPIGAFVTGWITERTWKRFNYGWAFLAAVAGGLVVLYLIGIPWMLRFVISKPTPRLPTWQAAVLANAVFLPGDLIKAAVAAAVAVTVRRAYPLIETPTTIRP